MLRASLDICFKHNIYIVLIKKNEHLKCVLNSFFTFVMKLKNRVLNR